MNFHKAWYNKKLDRYLQIEFVGILEDKEMLLTLEEFLKEKDIHKWAYLIGRYGEKEMHKRGYRLVSLEKYFKDDKPVIPDNLDTYKLKIDSFKRVSDMKRFFDYIRPVIISSFVLLQIAILVVVMKLNLRDSFLFFIPGYILIVYLIWDLITNIRFFFKSWKMK